ncbi:MAG TPA: 2-phosphosulfolactate phosphatase [Solirubrobacterales bacterium]|nr:2-phosphosulfolactate phosphatase [Solirubrobacterales bacterium]
MRIVDAAGVEGAQEARGAVVVIDVFRAFTVSAYALAGGAREVIYAADLERAREVAASIPGAVLCAEVDGLPVEGVPISNSPTMIAAADLAGRTLVQRSSAGVQSLAAATGAEHLFAAGLVVAGATAREVLALEPELITLVASRPDHPEDGACAAYLAGLLEGRTADLEALLAPLRASSRFAELAQGGVPGFPATDLELALAVDRFDFPLPVERAGDGLLRVRRSP